MKKCVSGVIIFAIVLGVCFSVAGVTSKAIAPNFINNLDWSKEVKKDGMIGYSGHSSYKYSYFVYQSGSDAIYIYGVRKSNGSNVELGHFRVTNLIFCGGAITDNGAWIACTVHSSSAYKLRWYYYRFSDGSSFYKDVGTVGKNLSSFNYQIVAGSRNGSGADVCGMVFVDRNSDAYGDSYVGTYVSASTITDLGFTYGTNADYKYKVGSLLCNGAVIINTDLGDVYGLLNGMDLGWLYDGYSGPLIFSATWQYLTGTYYIYGVDPNTLSFCQYELNVLNNVYDVYVSVAVPAFFAGNPQIEEGAEHFPIQFGMSTGDVDFWYPGAKSVYEFNVQLLPDTESPGNFWEFGGSTHDIILNVSGLELSITDDFAEALSKYYDSVQSEMLDDIDFSQIESLGDISIVVLQPPDDSSDITLGEFISGLTFLDDDVGHSMFSIVIGLSIFGLVIGMMI